MPTRVRAPHVAILGAGEIGQAVARLVGGRASVALWDAAPGKVANQQPLDAILPRASVVFYCVPSWALAPCVGATAALLAASATIVSVTKGIEPTTKLAMDRYWPSVLPSGRAFALLLGPMLAEEIQQGMGAAAAIACADRKTYRTVARLFDPAEFHLEFSRDVHGAAMASVCKNVYALAMGMADGLGWGGNRLGWLASVALREMAGHLRREGASKQTIFSCAGAADFVATAFSRYSSNHACGSALAQDGMPKRSEGLASLPLLLDAVGEEITEYPLLDLIRRTCLDHADPRGAFEALFHG